MWSRLAGLAQKADALVITIGEQARTELSYFAGVRVECAIERVLWCNQSGPFCELGGYEISTRVLKNRRAAPGTSACIRVATADDAMPLRQRCIE